VADKLRIVNRALQRIGAKQLANLTENSRERLAVDAAYDDVVSQELMTNFWTFAIKRTKLTADNVNRIESATVAAGGSGYVVGEILTLTGGTGTAATLRVETIDGSGAVLTVSVTTSRGAYTAVPANPISTTSSGAGTLATITGVFDTGPFFGRSFQFNQPSDYLRSAPFDPKERARIKNCLFEGNQILTDDGGPLELRYVSDLTDETTPETLFHPLFANAISMRLAAEIAEQLVGSSAKLDRVEAAYVKFVNDARRVDAIEAGPIEPEIDEIVAVRQARQVDPALRSFS
jgi:hypothetical protein